MADDNHDLEQWGEGIISGKNRAFYATFLRRVLWVFSILFRIIVGFRVKNFLNGKTEQADFATMVVSVGNLTMGGTGKTPVVEKLTRELHNHGRQVAILTRGYKSKALSEPQSWDGIGKYEAEEILPKVVSDHANIFLKPPYSGDEPYMLAKNLPGVAVLVDKNRIKSARFALNYLGSDTFVLDDGMQYLKLRHKFDIVLIDQNSPFGSGSLIPRGTLREPPKHLSRTSLIIITKCKSLDNEDLIKQIRKYNKTAGIVTCRHEAVELENLFTGEKKPISYLNNKYIGAISGIAVPESFESLVESHGAEVLFHQPFADHHNFTQKQIDRFMDRCLTRDVDFIITTEKDAVRFPRPKELDTALYFLRIEIKILSGQEHWDEAIKTICGKDFAPAVEHGYQEIKNFYAKK